MNDDSCLACKCYSINTEWLLLSSARWGRAPCAAARRAAGPRAARTSLDLTLDLRAQHTRLTDLRNEINHLSQLKKRYVYVIVISSSLEFLQPFYQL